MADGGSITFQDYEFAIDTGWFSFADIQGYQRFYEMLMLGHFYRSCAITVKTAYNFDPVWIDVQHYFTSDLGQYITPDDHYGLLADTSKQDKTAQLSVNGSRGKCESIRFYITDDVLNDGHFAEDENLVALWRLNESNATDDAIDWSGNGHTLTQVNSPPCVAARFGNGRSFGSNQRLILTDSTPFEFQQFTVAGWIWYNGDRVSTTAEILQWGPFAGAYCSVESFIEWDHLGAGHIAEVIKLADGSLIVGFTSFEPGSSPFYYVKTWDGQNLKVYINGALDINYINPTRQLIDYSAGAGQLWVGNSINAFSDFNLPGYVDDLAFYRDVKDAAWVAHMATLPTDAQHSFSLNHLAFTVGHKGRLFIPGSTRKV